ncbi:MAG: hypothetical protein J6J77_03380 [Alistipes sp.]|nr:hypothetical protein [Alistipes sp.]
MMELCVQMSYDYSYSIDAYIACVTIGCGVPRMLVYVTPFVVSIGVAR